MENNLSKNLAQQRADQIHAFRHELELLEKDNILALTLAQKEQVNRYHQALTNALVQEHDIDVSQDSKNLSRGMQVASFFGALALAASVFFWFYQYWGFFTTSMQVIILFAAPLLTLFATYIIRQKEHTGYFAKLMALISFACFVLNLSMLGQIFNLTPSHNALALWCIYALLLAYAFDIRLLLSFAIMCFYGFIAAEVGTWSGMYWISMGEHPEMFLLPSLMLFIIPQIFSHQALSGFAVIYRVLSLTGLFLAILVLSHWGDSSFLPWESDVIEGFYQVSGFVLSVAFIVLGIKKLWAEVVTTANVFFVIFLYTKFFDWWWEWLPKYLFFFLLGATALLFLMVFNRLRLALKDQLLQQATLKNAQGESV